MGGKAKGKAKGYRTPILRFLSVRGLEAQAPFPTDSGIVKRNENGQEKETGNRTGVSRGRGREIRGRRKSLLSNY